MSLKKKKSDSLLVSINEIEMAQDKTYSFVINHKIDLSDDLCKLTGKVTGNIVLKIQNNFLMLNGTDFHAPLRLICDRCLEEYPYQLDFDINEAIEITDTPCVLHDIELKYDKCFETISLLGEIDVKELIRQYIIINLPLKKICKPNCKGIEYFLKEKTFNEPRWDSLIELKQRLEQGEN